MVTATATARWAAAHRDMTTMTTMMATGDNNDDGNGATCDKVDDDCDGVTRADNDDDDDGDGDEDGDGAMKG